MLYRSVPVFIGLVSSDPSLWVERRGQLLVSITRALICPQCEIRQFVVQDCMTAFALGAPSLAQYDTSDFHTVPAIGKPLEWAHGIPVEFIVSVVQVNAWRASNPGIPNEIDSLELELRTLMWTPKAMDLVVEGSCEDSYTIITRLAAQETWRHAVLIYIYMVRVPFSCARQVDGLNPMYRACVLLTLMILEFSTRYNRYSS